MFVKSPMHNDAVISLIYHYRTESLGGETAGKREEKTTGIQGKGL